MKFSLILATLGRDKEVEMYLESLRKQTYKNFELIIVDQNKEDFIEKKYEKLKNEMDIKYIRSDKKGLSISRNIGLKYVTGDIIAFPDDDCEYPENILYNVNEFFKNNTDINVMTCKSKDQSTGEDSNGKWLDIKTLVDTNNVLKAGISYTIFIKQDKVEDVTFDEKLGVGAYFGSGEESDMVLNLLHNPKYKALYTPDYCVYHPNKEENVDRSYNYALGLGALIKKEITVRNNKSYILKGILDIVCKPIVGMALGIVTFNRKKYKLYKNRFLGRVKGFIQYK